MFNLVKTIARFSLDHSNLSPAITTTANTNYKISSANPINGYLTANANKRDLHAVIMVHEWWGLNNSITKTAEHLANNNIKVFVPDLYRGKAAINAQDAGHKMTGLNWPQAIQDIRNIKTHFQANSKSVSIVGFCMGGALTFACLSSINGWKMGAPFYGIPDLNIFRLQNIKCKVIAHFGRNDPLKGFSDAESAEKISKESQQKKYPIQIKIWEGVSHAFCNQDSHYFNQKVRDQAFNLTKKLIQQ